MFDAHCAVPPPLLLQFAAAIQPYDVMWIEEPVVPGNIEVFKKLRQAIKIPLATGERDRTVWELVPANVLDLGSREPCKRDPDGVRVGHEHDLLTGMFP